MRYVSRMLCSASAASGALLIRDLAPQKHTLCASERVGGSRFCGAPLRAAPRPGRAGARRGRPPLLRGRTVAGRRVLDVERLQLAADHEVVVVELQGARDAVLVELEADGVDGRLLALPLGLVEIADGDGPAPHSGERCL